MNMEDDGLQDMPLIPKQRPSANKFTRNPDQNSSPVRSPPRLREGGSQKVENPGGSIIGMTKAQTTVG